MRGIRALTVRAAALFNKGRRETDFSEELQAHLQMHIEDNIRSGLDPEAARRNALIRLGGLEATKEQYRDRSGIPFLEAVWKDIRFGLRVLRRNPGFTGVAVLTLALGIGANSAIFSVVNAVLLRPLPYPDSGRLVMIWATSERRGAKEDVASYPNFEDWRSESRSFEAMGAFRLPGANLSGVGDAEQVSAIQVTPGFFEMLRVAPEVGRTFTTSEGEVGGPNVALISDALWKTRFDGSRDVVGRTIRIDEETCTIIGVMPPAFSVTNSARELPEICTPLIRDTRRGHGFLWVVGRLKHGVSIPQAQSEMTGLSHRLAEMYPHTNKGIGVNMESLVDATVGNVRVALWILMVVVGAVLLIACANVANLMMSRNASRRREIAVRSALGAGRSRLVQQLLVESSLLAFCGGASGLLLATFTAKGLVLILSQTFEIPRIENTRTDTSVLLFTVALSMATGLVFGALPALFVCSPNRNAVLNEGGRAATESPRGRRIRGVLVVSEVALALVLFAGAGLLLKAFVALRSTAPGFQPERLVSFDFQLPELKYKSPQTRREFFGRALSSVRSVHGISSAALVADLPFGGGSDGMGFHIPGRPDPSPEGFSSNFNIASANYFKTMEIPLLAGREFTEHEGPDSPGVITINQTAARTFWPGESPIGKQILLPGPNKSSTTLTVVGVVGDVRQSDLGREPKPEIFLNYAQTNLPWPWLVLVARTQGDPEPMLGGLKNLAQSIDPDVPVLGVQTVDRALARSLGAPRTYTLLLSVFALLGLLIAAVGIYGVVSYTVAQRTHEIGIRMALGAKRTDILRMTLRQGLGPAAIGTMIGLAGALAAGRVLTHLIATVKPNDVLTLILVSVVLLIIATAATLVPAQRASAVDPNLALRCE